MPRSKYSNLPKEKKTGTASKLELPPRLAFKESEYDDKDVVRDYADLLSRTCRVWNESNFNPNTMNGGTGTLFNNGHHIPDGGAKTRKSFSNGVFAFCLEWITVVFDGKSYRVRCQNQFTVHSDQCTQHSKTVYKDGPNRVLSMLEHGETVTWDMLKDTASAAPLTGEQAKAKAEKECADLQSEVDRLDNMGEDVTKLRVELAKKKKALHEWQSVPANEGPAPNPIDGTILSSRRGFSKSARGNPVLDAKAKRNPNDKRAMRKSKAQTLPPVPE